MTLEFLAAVFMQISGTIGAGVFTLPYVFSRSNYIFATIIFVFLVVITGFLNQFYSEIVVSTVGRHQLAGYTQIYLGKKYKKMATVNLLLLAIGAITAYQKLFGSFLLILFPGIKLTGLIFVEASILWFLFSQSRSRSPFWRSFISILLVLIPTFLFLFSSFQNLEFRVYSFSPNFLFYGPAIFALSGFTIIPEIKAKFLPKASHLGLIVVAILYLLFITAVSRLSPTGVTPDSLTGVSASFPIIAKIVAIFGLLVTFQATQQFLQIIRNLFFHDFNTSSSHSNIITILLPLITLLLTPVSLILILSLTGHITIFISALIICLIRLRLSRSFWIDFKIILVIFTFTAGLIAAFI